MSTTSAHLHRRGPLQARFTWTGLFLDRDHAGSMWIRDTARITLPCAFPADLLMIEGELAPEGGDPSAAGTLAIEALLNNNRLGTHAPAAGTFSWTIAVPSSARKAPVTIELRLLGVSGTNFRAWLGRVFANFGFARRWQPFRSQPKNKRLRIRRVAADEETILDFTASATAFATGFVTRHTRIGMNLVGWFRAELGVGESVRCAARAVSATDIPHALVPLKLFCKAAQGETAFQDRLQEDNPHPVNVVHVDAPQMPDLDHHHGRAFRRDKYTIGYWAWELPEFPDGWVRYFASVDEIWSPSRFTRDAIAAKAPVPVIAMPHAIEFAVPNIAHPRATLRLPADRFLFLFIYDLNSYSERKNPRAVLRAFRTAFGVHGRADVGLVIKAHGIAGNERELAALREDIADLQGCTLIAETLPREQVTLLESACDAFVSLHRSEGFGLSVAECMYLGKPVISTDWSATAEFVTAENGCPVRFKLTELAENHGPYTRGQHWADPDPDHAAWFMNQLVDDVALRARLGAAAAATIRREFSAARIGSLYATRLRAMALW